MHDYKAKITSQEIPNFFNTGGIMWTIFLLFRKNKKSYLNKETKISFKSHNNKYLT